MMFLTRLFVIILTSCVTTRQARAGNLSENVQNFRIVYNGFWDNEEQIKEEGFKDYDHVQMKFVPVDIPALFQYPMVFIEEVINDKVDRLHLGVITEGSNKVINITPYNFTDTSKYKPGEYNVDDVYKLTLDELHGNPDCKAAIKPEGKGIFMGSYPDCMDTVNGQHPAYGSMYACDRLTFLAPIVAKEATFPAPYELKHVGPRYPVKDLPNNYTSPCDTS